MGTRASITICPADRLLYPDSYPVATLYRHWDGDPDHVIPDLQRLRRRMREIANKRMKPDSHGDKSYYEYQALWAPGYVASNLCALAPYDYQVMDAREHKDLAFAYVLEISAFVYVLEISTHQGDKFPVWKVTYNLEDMVLRASEVPIQRTITLSKR